jgi:hypothetical protein
MGKVITCLESKIVRGGVDPELSSADVWFVHVDISGGNAMETARKIREKIASNRRRIDQIPAQSFLS